MYNEATTKGATTMQTTTRDYTEAYTTFQANAQYTARTDSAVIVGNAIRKQIGVGVLMSLGAHDLGIKREGSGGLQFTALILPFTKKGHRGTKARRMSVEIILNGADYYDIAVTYWAGDEHRVHYAANDVDAFSLSRTLFALDYNGEQTLNPRYL